MPIALDQWWGTVDHQLDLIEAGARMCARHAEALPARPVFRTLAEDDMRRCQTVLEQALIDVRKARAIYRKKPVEG